MTISICIGSSCHLKGSKQIVEQMQALVSDYNLDEKVVLKGAFCMGNCVNGVCVKVEDELFSLTPETTEEFFKNQVLAKLA